MNTHFPAPRECYWICSSQAFNPHLKEMGYIPSLVVEGEPGHSPLMGQGECATPWYWGMTYEAAKVTAAKANMETFGLSEKEVFEIVTSSMVGSRLARA